MEAMNILCDSEAYDVKLLTNKLATNPSRPTIYRWIQKGIRLRRGQERIKLKAARMGKSFVTTDQAVSEFFRQLNEEK